MIFKLLLNKLRRNKIKSSIIIITFIICILFSLFLIFFYQNIESIYIEEEIGEFNARKFEIGLKDKNKNLLNFGEKQSSAKEETLNKLNQLSGYIEQEHLYYFYNIAMPVSASINFLGQTLESDFFLFVASDNYFEDKVDPTHYLSGYIPIGVNDFIINMYNLQLANGTDFPSINKEIFYNIGFTLFFNKSTIFDFGQDYISKKGKIVLMDVSMPFIPFTITYSDAKKIMDDLDKELDLNLIKIVGYVKDEKYLNLLEKNIDNFELSTDIQKIQEIQDKLSILRLAFIALNIIVIIVLFNFLIYIIYSIIDSNKKIFEIFRLHGAKRLKILSLILLEIYIFFIISFIILIIFYFIINEILINYLNDYIKQNYIDYQINIISLYSFVWINLIYFALITFITILFSYSEWNKKFEN